MSKAIRDTILNREQRLISLAQRVFGELNHTETRLLKSVATGGHCTGEKDCQIRGEVISWLCLDSDVSTMVTRRGIQIENAQISGNLDLRYAKMPFGLTL